MSNGINPNEHNRINKSNLNQQKKGSQPESAAEQEAAAQAAPDHHQPVDPSKIMDFLSSQGMMNISNVENVPVVNSMMRFLDRVSPENHEKLYASFEKAFQEEFGITANPNLVQEALDDYLIGTPVIQQ